MSNFNEALSQAWAHNLGANGELADEDDLFYVTPKGGVERQFYGVIERDPPERVGPDGMVTKPKAVFTVANSSSGGIALSEVQTGILIRFNLRYGVSSSATMNARLAPMDGNQGAAVLKLEV